MKGLYWTGILLLYFYLVLGDGQQDCLVDDVYKKEHWSGEEMTFFTYVSDNDVVNIKITYKFLEDTDYFTTFYFSPSKKYSKIIETKYGEGPHHFPLKTMKNENEWVKFTISSEKGTIQVFYEPNTHQQIAINQTSHTFKDLTISASNISFCKDEREWKVNQETHQIIPLGRDISKKSFPVHIYSPIDGMPVAILSIHNNSRSLNSGKYGLVISENKATLTSLKNPIKDIMLSEKHNVTTIEIFSQLGSFTVSLSFDKEPQVTSTKTSEAVTNEEICPTCNKTAYIAGLTPIVIFIIATLAIGISLKFNIWQLRIKLINRLLKNKKGYELAMQSIQMNRNQDNNSEEVP